MTPRVVERMLIHSPPTSIHRESAQTRPPNGSPHLPVASGSGPSSLIYQETLGHHVSYDFLQLFIDLGTRPM